ncbi:MAG: type IV toxin-antitoxin system AbiEi family antitoxin domain-containing protein [Acidimicrobiia bacterium]
MNANQPNVVDLALAQGGVATRRQLLELGLTKRQIDYRVNAGDWTLVKRGVYQIAQPRDRRDLLRRVIAVWERSVLSHETAAELHDFPYVDRGRIVVSHHSRTTHDFPDVEVHRTHDLDEWHITRIEAMPVTTIARTVVDLSATRSARHVGAITDRLVSDGRLELVELAAVHGAVARRGKGGTQVLREVLEARFDGMLRDESELERRGRRVITDGGLPLPVSEFPIPWNPSRRFDEAYPDLKIAIEWDSRRYHGQLAAFESDRARDRDAALEGWRVLRFTWNDVHNHPHRVVETIRGLLAA